MAPGGKGDLAAPLPGIPKGPGRVEKPSPLQCRGCAKRFETYNSLIKHKKRLHAEEKPLKKACDRCDKVYLDPKALKQHIKQESISSFYPRYRRFS